MDVMHKRKEAFHSTRVAVKPHHRVGAGAGGGQRLDSLSCEAYLCRSVVVLGSCSVHVSRVARKVEYAIESPKAAHGLVYE